MPRVLEREEDEAVGRCHRRRPADTRRRAGRTASGSPRGVPPRDSGEGRGWCRRRAQRGELAKRCGYARIERPRPGPSPAASRGCPEVLRRQGEPRAARVTRIIAWWAMGIAPSPPVRHVALVDDRMPRPQRQLLGDAGAAHRPLEHPAAGDRRVRRGSRRATASRRSPASRGTRPRPLGPRRTGRRRSRPRAPRGAAPRRRHRSACPTQGAGCSGARAPARPARPRGRAHAAEGVTSTEVPSTARARHSQSPLTIEAAVDPNDLAGDEGRAVGGEEERRARRPPRAGRSGRADAPGSSGAISVVGVGDSRNTFSLSGVMIVPGAMALTLMPPARGRPPPAGSAR